MSTALYDFFRFIKLYSPDGSTLEQTLEADSTQDSLIMRRSDGVSWNTAQVNPSTTLAVTVGVDTTDGKIQGNYYIDGTEAKSITLVRGQTYTFDQSDTTNAGYGGYNSPLVLSNTADGAISGAISGQEYTTGVTYLIDDVAVTKADYKLDFTTTTNRKVRVELDDSAPTTFYYGSHDTTGQGGTITTSTGSDIMQINVDYTLDVPVGTTNVELTDVNSNTTHVEFTGTGGIQLTRRNANEIEIGSFAVAEIDTLHTVTTRNAITTNKIYLENLEVGNVTSATEDGFTTPGADFLGDGTVDNALRLSVANRDVTANTITRTFTFDAKAAPGILNYTIGHQLDSGTAATSVTTSIQKYNGVTWDTLDTVTGVTGLPYEVSNMYNDSVGGGEYRVVFAIAGNTGTITLELQAYYEIIEITDNPVLRTDTAVGTIWTRDLSPMGVNDIGRGSEPYDNVYANTFHGHLQGTFDGDLTGSLYSDDSTLLVDAINGIIYGTVDANINRGTTAFTLDAGTISIESSNSYDLTVNSGNDAYYYSDFGNTLINAGEALTLSAVDGININSPVNTVIQGTAGFEGDLTGSVFAPDSGVVIDNNGVVIGEVNNTQVTSANISTSNFTDNVGTITGGNVTDFIIKSEVYGTDGSSHLVDVGNNQIVGEINSDTNRTGALTIASDTSIAVNGTGTIAFNTGVGVNADGELINSSNAAQPFTIASPVTPEKEFRSAPGIQYKNEYTNVTSGTYAIDASSTENVYWNAPSGALVANITNLETTAQRLRIMRIFIDTGSTAVVPSIEINGVTQSFVNLGPVAAQVNTVNVFEFMFYRTHTSTWEVYCRNLDANGYTLDAITDYGNTTTNGITVGSLTTNNVRVGNAANTVDTSTGNLTLDSTGGTVSVNDNLTVTGNTTLQGNTIIGNAVTDTITIQTVTGTPTDAVTPTGYMDITINGTTRYVPYYT